MPDLADPLALALGWRPQRYGRKAPNEIRDPLVEPLWTGPRVLVAATPDTATLVHDGTVLSAAGAVREALPSVVLATGAVIEGVLSQQALETGVGAYTAPETTSLNPLKMIGRTIIPGVRRRDELVRERDDARQAEIAQRKLLEGIHGATVAFVATDLLWLEGEELLDVPLLERKRLLESVLGEAELVRRTAFVRPSAAGSLLAWRSLGFLMLAYKAADSRYRPGESNPGWTTAPAPTHAAPPSSRGPS